MALKKQLIGIAKTAGYKLELPLNRAIEIGNLIATQNEKGYVRGCLIAFRQNQIGSDGNP